MSSHILIYSTKEFKLYKSNKDVYMIKFSDPNEKLINSLINTYLLPDTTISSDNKTLIFKGESAISLTDYKKKVREKSSGYEDGLRCLFSLTKQLEYLLKKESASFYTYEPENIVIINETIYLYLSSEHLIELKNNKIKFTHLFEKTQNLSPEIKNIKSIPSEIEYKCVYYSLGLIIINILFFEDRNRIEEKEINITKRMETIEGTKLYYYLLRCMDENIERRTLLFI
jgi:hypothetical protein